MDNSPGRAVPDANWRNTIDIKLSERPLPVRMRLGKMQSHIVSGQTGISRPSAIITFQMATVATISVANLAMSMVKGRVR